MAFRLSEETKKLTQANKTIEMTQAKFSIFLQHYNDRENPELEEHEKIGTDVVNKIIDEVKAYQNDEKLRRSILFPGVDFDQRITPFSEDRPLQLERVPMDEFIDGQTNGQSAEFGGHEQYHTANFGAGKSEPLRLPADTAPLAVQKFKPTAQAINLDEFTPRLGHEI